MAQHHLAEEDMNFMEMHTTEEHPTDTIDRADINEFGDPLEYLIALEEAQARAKHMTLRNEPISLGKFRRSKV